MIRKDNTVNEGLSLPFNLLQNSSFDAITVDLGSSDDVYISDLYQNYEEWDLYNDEGFFEFGYGGSPERNMLILPWFPYWSSCVGFESRLHINYMLEGRADLSQNKAFCTVYDKETELTPVYSYDFMKDPVADYCNFNLTCQYEEEVGIGTRKRWWEISEGTTIFYLTSEAQSIIDKYDVDHEWISFSELHKNKLRYIPVTLTRSTKLATDQQQIPTLITLNIEYYQQDVDTKLIIDTSLEYDGWKDVPIQETTGQLIIDSFYKNGSVLLTDGDIYDLTYQLNINYKAVGYMEIFNNLHFHIFPLYIVLYFFIGGFMILFMF